MAEVVSSGLWNQELPRSATSLHCRRRRHHNAHTSTSLHPRNLRSGPAGMLTFVARPLTASHPSFSCTKKGEIKVEAASPVASCGFV